MRITIVLLCVLFAGCASLPLRVSVETQHDDTTIKIAVDYPVP